MTRRDALRDAARTLLLGLSGWAVGAALIVRFASGSVVADLDLIYLCVVVWVAVPVAAIAGGRLLGDGRRRRPSSTSRTSLVWAVIALATCAAVIDTSRSMAEGWSTMQVWLALAFVTPIGVAVGTVPELIGIEGFSGRAAATSGSFRVAFLTAALAAFAIALAMADQLLADARIVGYACDASVPADVCSLFQPTQPVLGTLGWGLVVAFGIGAIIAFAFDLATVAAGALGMLYLIGAFWIRYPWNGIIDGSISVASPIALLALHIAAALALIAAVAAIQLFRQPGGSETERELTAWLRAEAFLPEARPADGNATG